MTTRHVKRGRVTWWTFVGLFEETITIAIPGHHYGRSAVHAAWSRDLEDGTLIVVRSAWYRHKDSDEGWTLDVHDLPANHPPLVTLRTNLPRPLAVREAVHQADAWHREAARIIGRKFALIADEPTKAPPATDARDDPWSPDMLAAAAGQVGAVMGSVKVKPEGDDHG